MKLSLFITLLLLGFSSTPVAESKQPPSPEKIYLVTALAAGAIHRCEGYSEEDGNKVLEKFTTVAECNLKSGEMNLKEAEEFGHKLIDVFYYSKENPDIYPTEDADACASGGRLVKKLSQIEGC